MRYRCDSVSVHLAAFVDRDIFSGHEPFVREMKARGVRLVGLIVKKPTAALAMNQMTVFIVLAGPRSCDPTCLAMRTPERRIDLVVAIERRDNNVGERGIALGV